MFHRGAVAALAPRRPRRARAVCSASSARSSSGPSTATFPDDDAFRFRHLLIRDAAYEALPKATRAELHERFAVWLEERAPDLVELDEILGYHLEQAARYRRGARRALSELCRSAPRSGSPRQAGARARGDDAERLRVAAHSGLPALLEPDDPRRLALLPQLWRRRCTCSAGSTTPTRTLRRGDRARRSRHRGVRVLHEDLRRGSRRVDLAASRSSATSARGCERSRERRATGRWRPGSTLGWALYWSGRLEAAIEAGPARDRARALGR